MSALYATDSKVVAPLPLAKDDGLLYPHASNNASDVVAGKVCAKQDPDSDLPSRDELASMFYNKALVGIQSLDFWSSTAFSSDKAWRQNFFDGGRVPHGRSNNRYHVRCVKRD